MRWSSAQRYRTSKRGDDDAPFLLCPLVGILEGFSYGTGGFSDARNISAAGPRAGKGTPHETLDYLSHHTDRWALHLLQRSRSERRADGSTAARTSVFLADVRSSLRPAFRSLPPYRAGLSRLWPQRLAGTEKIRVHIRSHSRNHESLHRSAGTLAVCALHAGLRRARGFSHGLSSSGPNRGAHCSERRCAQRRSGSDLENTPRLLGRSLRQRECASRKPPVTRDYADAPRRERP